MPKKKSSRPNASLGSSQTVEPKSAFQVKRERTIRIAAIAIILALVLSVLAGALAITPSQPADAAGIGVAGKSVQILQVTSEVVDTDGDGIENNEDPDVDGDGLVNGEDSDIDGDGIENFEDADPIDTTDIDSNAPEKPSRPETTGDFLNGGSSWIWITIPGALAILVLLILLGKRRKKRS